MLMNYWLVESNNIARERLPFSKIWLCQWYLLDKYTTENFVPKSDRVKELFKDIFIPSARIGRTVLKSSRMVFTTKTA